MIAGDETKAVDTGKASVLQMFYMGLVPFVLDCKISILIF